MATIGKLAVQITADASGLKSGLTDAEKTVSAKADAISASVGRIGAAFAGLGVVAALKNMTLEAINTADAFDEMSEKTGVGVEKLSSLAYAAKINGATVDDLGTAIRALSNRMAESVDPASQAAQMFKGLGVSTQDAIGSLRNVDDVMMDLAGVFSSMEDGAAKSALAMDIFSRSGMSMIPVLNKGKDGLHDLRIEAERMGAVISTDMAKQSAAFNENIDRLATLSGTLGKTIANALVPELNKLINEFLNGIKYANGFWDALATFGTINPFKDLQGNLKSTREEIDNLNAARERYVKAGSDTSGIDQAIATEKRRLEYLKDIERQQVLNAQGPGNQTDAESRRLGLSKYQGPPPPPPKKDDSTVEEIKDPLGEFADKKLEEQAQRIAREEEMRNQFLARNAEAMKLATLSELDQEQFKYEEKIRILEEYLLKEPEMLAEYQDVKEKMAEAHEKRMLDIRRKGLTDQEKWNALSYKDQAKTVTSELMSMTGAAATENRKMFEINKAASLANAVIKGYESAVNAYAFGSKWGGPAGGAAMAALSVAATGAQINAIRAQSFGGGGGGTAYAPSGSTAATGQTAMQGTQQPSQSTSQVITIQGIGAGDMFSGDSVRGLIDQLIEAQRNGSKVVLS